MKIINWLLKAQNNVRSSVVKPTWMQGVLGNTWADDCGRVPGHQCAWSLNKCRHVWFYFKCARKEWFILGIMEMSSNLKRDYGQIRQKVLTWNSSDSPCFLAIASPLWCCSPFGELLNPVQSRVSVVHPLVVAFHDCILLMSVPSCQPICGDHKCALNMSPRLPKGKLYPYLFRLGILLSVVGGFTSKANDSETFVLSTGHSISVE